MAYDLNNPHPRFGKDPNIMDEFGRTHYPKYVTHKDTGDRVIVQNPKEEMEVTGKKPDINFTGKGKAADEPEVEAADDVHEADKTKLGWQ